MKKTIAFEFDYEVRGFQIFQVPENYEIHEHSPNEAYESIRKRFKTKQIDITYQELNSYDFGFRAGYFVDFGEVLEIEGENVKIIDFDFNKKYYDNENSL
jgi:hypothetical protein